MPKHLDDSTGYQELIARAPVPASVPASLTARGSTPEPDLDLNLADLVRRLVDTFPSRRSAAEAAGVSTDQIHKYMRGQNEPSFSTVARLAHKAGLSLDELATPARFVDAINVEIVKGALDSVSDAGAEFVRLPLYELISADGRRDSESWRKLIAFRRDWIASDIGVDPEHLALAFVSGDSMAPRLRAGDLVMLNTDVDRVTSDGIYGLVQEGTLLVKRMQKLPGRRFRVFSENPDYAAYEIDEGSLRFIGDDATFIAGRVVWAGVRL